MRPLIGVPRRPIQKTQAAVLSPCTLPKEIFMAHRLGLIAALGFTALLASGLSGCSADAQANLVSSTLTVASPYVAMPAPQAPFDETPITPVESAGAAKSD